jgi:hypothetical protein
MNCSRFSNNGQFVACVGWAGKFVVYDIENNEYMHNKTAHQAKNIWIVAVSKNDELLVIVIFFDEQSVCFFLFFSGDRIFMIFSKIITILCILTGLLIIRGYPAN